MSYQVLIIKNIGTKPPLIPITKKKNLPQREKVSIKINLYDLKVI